MASIRKIISVILYNFWYFISSKLLLIKSVWWRDETVYFTELSFRGLFAGVDASTVNAFKARLDKFWSHQAVKFDFTAVLTGTGNRSEELKK